MRPRTCATVAAAFAGLFLAFLPGCTADGPLFAPGPDPATDEALFWVSQRGGRLEWVRGSAGSVVTLAPGGQERFFSVLLRESELRAMDPRVEAGAIASLQLRERLAPACAHDFAVGVAGRRGFPLLDATPEILEMDFESARFGASSSANEALSILAVDVSLARACAESRMRVTELEFGDLGAVQASAPVGELRAAVINERGELSLFQLSPIPQLLSQINVGFGGGDRYAGRALRHCPQNGREMLYLAHQTRDLESGDVVGRLHRFDVTDGVLRDPELLDNGVVLDLALPSPSTCIAVGKEGLLGTSTSATSYLSGSVSAVPVNFEDVEIFATERSTHLLAASDGFVYRGRVDGGSLLPMGPASSYSLQSLAAVPRAGGFEVWATDANESLHRLRDDGSAGTRVEALTRFPDEIPLGCTATIDACGDRVAAGGLEYVGAAIGPAGDARLVISAPACPALTIADPATLCTYGIDLSAYASTRGHIRRIEGLGSSVWVTTAGGAFRLDWP